ncbi:MAG: CDP-alcohol phosphatidyltransferase family protein [Candidatus Altiarchaeota archaeon]|nr:CDP-alcohol phosphatidyltransferase family protein [Candidatus Altiarchaeota archaeon]
MIKSRADVEWFSVKLGTLFARLGLSPNIWTIMALVPALVGFFALYYGYLLYALIFFIISGAIDAIDGAVARVSGSVTELGAFLDGVIDRYVEILLYIGLLFYLKTVDEVLLVPYEVWIVLLVYGALMPSFVRAYADHRNVITADDEHKRMGGLLERAERLTLIYVGMLLGLFQGLWLLYIVILTAILANLTAFERIYYVLSHHK